jgi:hypothetical protein
LATTHPGLYWRDGVTIHTDRLLHPNECAVLNTGGWILSEGGNTTAGTLSSRGVIEFVGVPFIPPGAGDAVFQVENIFVNPSAEPPGFQFTGSGSIVGNVSIYIPPLNQQQVVAENAVPESFSLVFVGLGLGAMC